MSAAAVSPLPWHLAQHGSDADLLGKELLAEISHAITNHPRSLQVEIGPSEVGHPCARRIGYKLLGYPEKAGPPNWKATVGTALHAWLEEVIGGFNRRTAADQALDHRFIVEQDLICGTIGPQLLRGHCDLYDRVTDTVVDWKSVGPTQLKKYKSKGPGEQYRAQAHIYGRGWALRGFPVQRVAVMFLPRDGELSSSYWWTEPYDEQIALDAIARAEAIQAAVRALGRGALEQLATADAWCQLCPFHKAGSQNIAAGCPGDEKARIPHGAAPVLTLT